MVQPNESMQCAGEWTDAAGKARIIAVHIGHPQIKAC